MRITEILTENVKVQKDNPGGEWLDAQREKAKTGRFGSGANTANIGMQQDVLIKVDYIKNLRGVNREETIRYKSDKFKELLDKVKEEGWNPKYPIMIWVDYQGIAKIAEGNHRVAVADTIGAEWIPVEIRYYAGGEQVEGPFKPETLKAKNVTKPA